MVNLNLSHKCWHSSSRDLNNEACNVWSADTNSVSGEDIICLFIYFSMALWEQVSVDHSYLKMSTTGQIINGSGNNKQWHFIFLYTVLYVLTESR